MANMDDLLKKAIDKANKVKSERLFIVKDLFEECEWDEIVDDKLSLGRLFLKYVEENPSKIEILKKTLNDQQVYKKLW